MSWEWKPELCVDNTRGEKKEKVKKSLHQVLPLVQNEAVLIAGCQAANENLKQCV